MEVHEPMYYETGQTKVTKSRLVVENQMYDLSAITSMTIKRGLARREKVINREKQQRGRSRVIAGISLTVVSAAVVAVFAGGESGYRTVVMIGFLLLAFIGIVLLLLGILDGATASGTDHIPAEFQLVITTSDGEHTVASLPELESVEAIRDAINAAKSDQQRR